MKKLVVGACLACSLMLVAGCSSKPVTYTSHEKVNGHVYGADVEDAATVKTVQGITIISVDGKRIASRARIYFRGGWDVVKLSPGKHSLVIAKNGQRLNLKNAEYKSGHEYLVDQIVHGKRTYFWVEELATGTVILGQKKTPQDFVAQE